MKGFRAAALRLRRMIMSENLTRGKEEQKKSGEKSRPQAVTYRRLVYEFIPELWSFQTFSGIVLTVLTIVSFALLDKIAETNGSAVTTANLGSLILSWRLPMILAVGFVVVAIFVIVEIFTQIHNCYDILNGHRAGFFRELKKSIPDIRRFLNPAGIGLIVYVFLAVPITGIGFSIRLSASFSIPNFMINNIGRTPWLAAGFAALVVFLVITGIRWLFAFHAVLIDKVHPKEGMKISVNIIKKHWKTLLKHVLKYILILFLIYLLVYIVFDAIPKNLLIKEGAGLPPGYRIDPDRLEEVSSLSQMEMNLISYRVLSVLYVLFDKYVNILFAVLSSAYLVLLMTKDYLTFTRGEVTEYRPRPKRFSYRMKVAAFAGIFFLLAIASMIIGPLYTPLFEKEEPVKIIAHRCGGTMAVENSMEGIERAIEHGCYGSETDIQRSKDGFYVITHDDTFKRMAGVSRPAKDMTLEQIHPLTIRDDKGEGAVPELDDMLDVIKGKEVLFIELKGKTADRKMADDVVRMVREKDCVEDVVIISLRYDLIDYTETAYPEFETGILVFAGLGGIERLNCDLLIMDEEMATDKRIYSIHQAGKKAVAWKVNTEYSIERFFDSEVDAIITDEVELAQEIWKKFASRTDLEVIKASIDAVINRLKSNFLDRGLNYIREV